MATQASPEVAINGLNPSTQPTTESMAAAEVTQQIIQGGSSRIAPKSAKGKATRHEVLVPQDATRYTGTVVSRQEKFGFVKCTETDARLFFHHSDTDGAAPHGAQVSFIIAHDTTTNRDVAFDVKTVSQRPQHHDHRGREEIVPGAVVLGVVAAVPKGPASIKIDDGMILFTDASGSQQHAWFGNWRVLGDPSFVKLGAGVVFNLVRNSATKVLKAVGVRYAPLLPPHFPPPTAQEAALGKSGADADGSVTSERQLGRVALLKKEFGFIRQVARPGDLFFHFSQLEGIDPAEVKPGDDVEFFVRQDRDGRLSAASVRRAPPGAVAFEVASDQVLRGVVLERPVVTKQYLQSSGVLEFDDPGSNGEPPRKARLVFAPQDCIDSAPLRPGDHATFKIMTNVAAAAAAQHASVPGAALMAGRRAVEVTPVRLSGVVATTFPDRKFGFLHYVEPEGEGVGPKENEASVASGDANGQNAEHAEDKADAAGANGSTAGKEGGVPAGEGDGAAAAAGKQAAKKGKQAQQKIFFHFTEVAAGIVLKPGDEVTFAMHTNLKNGELNAARVKRTKEASPPAVMQLQPSAAPEKAKPAAKVLIPMPTHNPNKPKLTGNLQSGEHKSQKMPKGPDGTKGFVGFPRGKALEDIDPETPAGSSPYALFCGLPLKGIGPQMVRSLSVGAPVFVPKSASTASLGGMEAAAVAALAATAIGEV